MKKKHKNKKRNKMDGAIMQQIQKMTTEKVVKSKKVYNRNIFKDVF